MRRPLHALPLAGLVALTACAAAGVRTGATAAIAATAAESPAQLATSALRAWIVGGDVAAAERGVDRALRAGDEPWAHLGAALLARRHLDEAAEAKHLVELVASAPDHPLAPIAVARLQQLATLSAPMAQVVQAGLGPVRAHGLAALRIRQVLASAALLLGDRARAEALRAAGATVPAWTLAGPFGALHALEFDTPFEPERGRIPASVSAGAALPDVPSRVLPSPEGLVVLDGEPAGGDIYYLAADAVASKGGEYLLAIRSNVSVRAWVDGRLVLERRAFATFAPTRALVSVALGPGRHHVLVKLARGNARAECAVAVGRADGADADLRFEAPAPGSASLPVALAGPPAPEIDRARAVVAALEREVAPEVARWVVATDAVESDRELAKVLVHEAIRSAPATAPLLALRADIAAQDPTVSDRTGRAAAESDLDRALALDPADSASRLARADLALAAGRLEDVAELLEALPADDATAPRALVARARAARARNLPVVAEQAASEARRATGDCAALDLLFNLPSRRDAFASQDQDAAALSRCRNGLEQLVEHRRRRGDLRGAIAAADELVRDSPARVDRRLLRAALVAADGRPRDAAADLAALAALWPRDARIEKQRAEWLEAAGDPAAALAARERALRLDGGDLTLRRALALERGHLPLDEWAEDGIEAIARYRRAAPVSTTSTVTVLDFGAVEAHPGGAYTERIHTIVEARDERAVDRVGEVSVPDGAEILVARTVKRDGAVLDAEDPVGDKRSLSLPALEPGDFAEWAWIRTVPARGPAIPGFSADAFFFQADMPLWRSTYVVSAPADVGFEVDAHNMERVQPARDGDRVVLRVTREDVPPLLAEPNAPGDAEQLPFLQVGAGAGADALARAIGDALLEAFRPNVELRTLAESLRAGAAGQGGDALVRAAYRRVNDLVLGGGGFDEGASTVLSRARGNRTVVLKALLDLVGVRARVALVREAARDPAPYRFPRPDRFAYAVLRVEHAGQTIWLDPTTRGTPYGVLPPEVRDAEAIVLPEPGERVITTRTPAGEGERDRRVTSLTVTVDEEGAATLEGREEYRGYEAASPRAALEPLDAAARRQAVEHARARNFRAPSLLAVGVEGESDFEAPLVVRWRVRVERWARLEAGRAVVETPILPARLGARFLQRAERQRALLIPHDEAARLTVSVQVPPTWKAVPSAPVNITEAYGALTRNERLDGGRLVREEQIQLRRGRVSPQQYPAFGEFARSVDAAQQRPLVFTVSSSR